MKLERAIKKYYSAKLRVINTPRVSALNFEQSRRPVQKPTYKTDMLLNIFVHAAIAVMIVFAFYPGRQDFELSLAIEKRAEELELNKHLNNGLIMLLKYIKPYMNLKN